HRLDATEGGLALLELVGELEGHATGEGRAIEGIGEHDLARDLEEAVVRSRREGLDRADALLDLDLGDGRAQAQPRYGEALGRKDARPARSPSLLGLHLELRLAITDRAADAVELDRPLRVLPLHAGQ